MASKVDEIDVKDLIIIAPLESNSIFFYVLSIFQYNYSKISILSQVPSFKT